MENACRNGNLEELQRLAEEGNIPQNCITIAIENNQTDVALWLINRQNYPISQNVLAIAFDYQNAVIMRQLLETRRLNPNVPESLFFDSLFDDNLDIANILYTYGARLQQGDIHPRTLLELMKEPDSVYRMYLAIQGGLDINQQGGILLYLALRHRKPRIVQLLLQDNIRLSEERYNLIIQMLEINERQEEVAFIRRFYETRNRIENQLRNQLRENLNRPPMSEEEGKEMRANIESKERERMEVGNICSNETDLYGFPVDSNNLNTYIVKYTINNKLFNFCYTREELQDYYDFANVERNKKLLSNGRLEPVYRISHIMLDILFNRPINYANRILVLEDTGLLRGYEKGRNDQDEIVYEYKPVYVLVPEEDEDEDDEEE